MGCVPCAAKARLRNQKFEWTQTTTDPETGEEKILTVVYATEAAAKTKVRKRGGTYRPLGE